MQCLYPEAKGTGGYCRGCRCSACTDKKLSYNDRRRRADKRIRIHEKAKQGAKKRGIHWDLEIKDIVIPDTCPILGIPIFRTGTKRTANSPSLDRIDNNIGYTKNNVHVISWRANDLKKDATPEEIFKLAEFFKSL